MSEFDFWDMTIGEIARYYKGVMFRKEQERKERASFDYTLAVLIGSATVGQMSKGSKMPTLEEAYPDVFKIDEEPSEEAIKKKVDISVARFMQFANSYNAKLKSEEIENNEFRDMERQD